MRALALGLVLLVTAPARADAPPDDSGRTRYLFAPSALLLRGGEVVLSQTELVFTSVALGLGGHATVLAGSVLPALLSGANGMNLALEVKVGWSAAALVHLAAGLETVALPNVAGFYGLAVVTLGREAWNATLGAGAPLAALGTDGAPGPPLFFAAAGVRAGRHLALATEHWLFPTRPELPLVSAGALRVLAGRVAIGVGAARVAPLRVPLPWVDLAVRVGG